MSVILEPKNEIIYQYGKLADILERIGRVISNINPNIVKHVMKGNSVLGVFQTNYLNRVRRPLPVQEGASRQDIADRDEKTGDKMMEIAALSSTLEEISQAIYRIHTGQNDPFPFGLLAIIHQDSYDKTSIPGINANEAHELSRVKLICLGDGIPKFFNKPYFGYDFALINDAITLGNPSAIYKMISKASDNLETIQRGYGLSRAEAISLHVFEEAKRRVRHSREPNEEHRKLLLDFFFYQTVTRAFSPLLDEKPLRET